MFGKRFAYQFEGGDDRWTPPWLREEWGGHRHEHGHRHDHGHHRHGPFGHHGPEGWGDRGGPPWGREERFDPRFFMRRGRGPFGPGGPFGPEGPFGPGGEVHRFFGRGDIKFALLELLQERPMHGYEMIKALEEKFNGFYTPSPGSVYPTLQMLEDRGAVVSQEQDGKRVYSITDAGRAMLAENQKERGGSFEGPPWMRHRGRHFRQMPEMQALGSEVAEVTRLLAIAGKMSFQDPEQLARLRGIIERTRKDLSDMIYSAGSQPQQNQQSSAPQEPAPDAQA